MKIIVTKEVEISEDDFICILSSANCYDGIGYWANLIDNEKHYAEAKKQLIADTKRDDCDLCMEDVWLQELKMGYPLIIEDYEEDTKYDLTMEMLEKAIEHALKEGYWDGEGYNCDGTVSDNLFQFAIFGDIIYS